MFDRLYTIQCSYIETINYTVWGPKLNLAPLSDLDKGEDPSVISFLEGVTGPERLLKILWDTPMPT